MYKISDSVVVQIQYAYAILHIMVCIIYMHLCYEINTIWKSKSIILACLINTWWIETDNAFLWQAIHKIAVAVLKILYVKMKESGPLGGMCWACPL